jgi:hypothetical protein
LRVLPEILTYCRVGSGFRVLPRLAAGPLVTFFFGRGKGT